MSSPILASETCGFLIYLFRCENVLFCMLMYSISIYEQSLVTKLVVALIYKLT